MPALPILLGWVLIEKSDTVRISFRRKQVRLMGRFGLRSQLLNIGGVPCSLVVQGSVISGPVQGRLEKTGRTGQVIGFQVGITGFQPDGA